MRKVMIGILVLCVGIGALVLHNALNPKKVWTVEILNEKINMRQDAGIGYPLVGKVVKGDVLKVTHALYTDSSFNWYRVEINRYKAGWIATPKNGTWLLDMNNPEGDIYSPRIKYYEEEHHFYSEQDVNYDHLSIKDESSFTVTHQIYKEEKTEDTEEAYWITYTATDANGQSKTSTQRTTFAIPPTNWKILN